MSEQVLRSFRLTTDNGVLLVYTTRSSMRWFALLFIIVPVGILAWFLILGARGVLLYVGSVICGLVAMGGLAAFLSRSTIVVDRTTRRLVSQARLGPWGCRKEFGFQQVQAVRAVRASGFVGVRLSLRDGTEVPLDGSSNAAFQQQMADNIARYLDVPVTTEDAGANGVS